MELLKVPGIRVINLVRRVIFKQLKVNFSFNNIRPKDGSFSSLYISGRYGDKLYPTAIPYFDLNYYVSHFQEVLDSLKRRDQNVSLDESFKSYVVQLMKINSQIEKTFSLKSDLDDKLKNCISVSSENVEISDRLTNIGRQIRSFIDKKWELEEIVMPVVLKIPNAIHPKVTEKRIVLHESGFKPTLPNVKSHIDLGLQNNYLEFTNFSPSGYYLIGPVAELELSLIQLFVKNLKSFGLNRVSLPNIVKSAIVEACGKSPFEGNETVRIYDKKTKWGNYLHVVGSASLEAFVSYFTRIRLATEDLPISFFCVGRKYHITNASQSGEPNLFKPFQSTGIGMLNVSPNDTVSVESFDKMYTSIQHIFEQLELPLQISQVSVQQLKNIESLRVNFEVWSPFLKTYVECAYVSLYGQYLSKRLMICHNEQFSSLYSGNINVTALIACIMENNQNSKGEITLPKLSA